ncbi:MAG: glycosyltransferase [Parasphingopyxis sp.]|nr:hypothetical protein [Sphingomonadales bacterium]
MRLRQKAKRRLRVPDTVPGDVAQRMRLVDEALERAAAEGVRAAASALEKHRDEAQRGRALAELALFALESSIEEGAEIGLRAAELAPGEPRLLTLIARLQAAGGVTAPARIGRLAGEAQPLSPPQRQWLAGLARDAGRLAGDASALAERKGEAKPIAHLALIAPEGWRAHPRIRAAELAARAAGLSVGFETPRDTAGWGAHIFPDSLDFAEQALAACRDTDALLLDLANRPRELDAGSDSEVTRVARMRLGAMIAAADTVIARGPAANALAEAHGAMPECIDDVWPDADPPDDEDIATARLEFGLGEQPTVLAAADLSDENGLHRLLRVFGEFGGEKTSPGLAFLGSGPAAPQLALLAAEYGLEDRVTFVGSPAFERWPALFGCCAAAIFPGQQSDSFGSAVPLAMLLAARLGIPALQSDAAWESRTSDSLIRSPLGEDWKSAIIQTLEVTETPERRASSDRLEGLYQRLRAG